jgi:hypothetical protein
MAPTVRAAMVLHLGPSKYQMVHEADPPERLTEDENAALQLIAGKIREQRLPPEKVHVVCVCLEAVKVFVLTGNPSTVGCSRHLSTDCVTPPNCRVVRMLRMRPPPYNRLFANRLVF